LAETDTFESDATDCNKVVSLPPERVEAACSRLLADPEVRYGMKQSLVSGLYFNRAFALHKLKNYARALQDLNLAIGLNAGSAIAYTLRGKVKADMGQDHAAILDYNQCVRLKPRDEICHFNRASSHVRLRNYVQAVRDFTAVIRIEPKSPTAYAGRGAARDYLRQHQAAIADYRMAINLGSQDPEVRKRLAALEAVAVSPQTPQAPPPPRAAPAPGTPVNLTWRFRNNTGATVHVKMYARGRGIWWPGANSNWRMDHVGPFAFTINCRAGEKVCYGAWQAGNTDRHWGVGFQDKHGCQNCCYACREGQTTQYNLNP
jgi:tetratricopeptide (TPR) repeat protein